MTSPAPLQPESYATIRSNWLGRYLQVEKGFDKELYTALDNAAKDVDTVLAKFVADTEDTKMRRVQLSLAHNQIRGTLKDLFGTVGTLIRGHRKIAAEAAVQAGLADERSLVNSLFKHKSDRQAFEASLRQAARNNIESVAARVLFSEQPLSQRVYRTRALANGMVSRAINNGLARGDSAADIARNVTGLIRPDTPGGVSYAARRLGRTEINNAYHAQAIANAQDKPWVHQMRWYLSKVHKDDPGDACEEYAQIGLFDVEHVPNKPHPNCRCFVVPEPDDYDLFEQRLLAGQYDSYLDSVLDNAPKPPVDVSAMQASPPQPPTTKASQPPGWTGPPVSKSAQNPRVINVVDSMWNKYDGQPEFLQVAREGSRKVQTKGYRGGLSAQGKKNLLAQEENLIADEKNVTDIGRELTARLAYADPSKRTVYRAVRLTDSQYSALALSEEKPMVSIPLSGFDKSEKLALQNLKDIGPGNTVVVLQVDPGAKVAEIGQRRFVTMGEFEVQDFKPTTKTKPAFMRLKQIDIREFEAGVEDYIPDIEVVAEGKKVPHLAVPKPKVSKVDPADIETRLRAASSSRDVETLLVQSFPDINFDNVGRLDLDVARGLGLGVNDMEDRFPLGATADISVGSAVAEYGPGYGNAYAVTGGVIQEDPTIRTAKRLPARRWKGSILVDKEKTKDIAATYSDCIAAKFHPKINNLSAQAFNRLPKSARDELSMRAIITHEMAHSIDNRLNKSLTNQSISLINRAYEEAGGEEVWGSYTRFVRMNAPSIYAFEGSREELVAEAITDVVMNGYENAKLLSQRLWDYLVVAVRKPMLIMPGESPIPDPLYTKG